MKTTTYKFIIATIGYIVFGFVILTLLLNYELPIWAIFILVISSIIGISFITYGANE